MKQNLKVTTRANEFLGVDSILIRKIKNLRPKEIYLVQNEENFSKATQTMSKLIELIKKDNNKFTYKIELDKLTGSLLFFTVKTDFLVLNNLKEFSNLIQETENFDIVAHTDGKFSISFQFSNVYEPAPPYKK